MSLKQELIKKVPAHLKEEPHFQTLLEHIKTKGIESKEHLRDFLQQEIALVETWMGENKNSAAFKTKTKRDKANHLGVLRKCLELSEKFLF